MRLCKMMLETKPTFLLTPPNQGRPVIVLVEQNHNITSANFISILEWYDAPVGMLFRPDETEIYIEEWPPGGVVGYINYKPNTVSTSDILSSIPSGSFEQKVHKWLQLLTTNWNQAIPNKLTNIFVPNVIGRTAGCSIDNPN